MGLTEIIKQEISIEGYLPFDRFMSLALYHPEYGYYTTKSDIIGAAGDFVTAPELSKDFSRCLSHFCRQQFTTLAGSLLEFGAGNGAMAADLLSLLGDEIEQYTICEISPNLKERQQQRLSRSPHYDKVQWLDTPPENFSGIILANEMFDALPVKCFQLNDAIDEMVVVDDDGFKWGTKTADDALKQQIQQYCASDQLVKGYQSELCIMLDSWFKQLDAATTQAVMCIIDYGFGSAEYYHPSRSMGTIMCHYQHQCHPDPLIHVGQQDITAHVNFTHIAEVADALGWGIDEYMSQAYFLLEHGILDNPNNTQAIKQLTLPHEMGELFKVMLVSKNHELVREATPWPSLLNRL